MKISDSEKEVISDLNLIRVIIIPDIIASTLKFEMEPIYNIRRHVNSLNTALSILNTSRGNNAALLTLDESPFDPFKLTIAKYYYENI